MVILYELINANLTILILIHFIEKSSYNFIELILKFLSFFPAHSLGALSDAHFFSSSFISSQFNHVCNELILANIAVSIGVHLFEEAL